DGWQITSSVDLGPGSLAEGTTLVLLADPFTFPVDAFVAQLVEDAPGLVVVGGLASAARGPGGNRLAVGGDVHETGAVGLFLPPGIGAHPLVSQGCRPVGTPLVVTKAERNMIYEIAGQPALDRFYEVAARLSPEDRSLLAQGPHLGVAIDEHKIDFERGDFLVRNVMGADREARAIAVGDEVAVGTTVQFHVRDADSADEDLRATMAGTGGQAALVFTCNGRGMHLFGEPDHDASVINDHLDGGAVAGMFCAGEIGPVGGRPFLHGFTASVLLFD
ncbi:MAG TPA: FIST C-terminal domain-containing protein, partial [Acidimicrobiales bacterium]